MLIAGIAVLVVMLATSFVLGENVRTRSPTTTPPGTQFLKYPIVTETKSLSGELTEGATSEEPLALSGLLIKNISATLTWEDENDPPGRPRIRRYENQPDTFALAVQGMNVSKDASGSNEQGGSGTVEVKIMFTTEELAKIYKAGTSGNWTATVTLQTAGIWTPMIGIIGLTDPGNSYSLVIEYEYYDMPSSEEGES